MYHHNRNAVVGHMALRNIMTEINEKVTQRNVAAVTVGRNVTSRNGVGLSDITTATYTDLL